MEILYPNGSLNHLEAMEVTETTVHGKEIQKTSPQRHKTEHKPCVCLEFSLGPELVNKKAAGIPTWKYHRAEQMKQRISKCAKVCQLGTASSYRELHPRLWNPGEGSAQLSTAILHGTHLSWSGRYNWRHVMVIFFLENKKVLPIYWIAGEKFSLKGWKQPKGMAAVCADTFPPTGTHHSTAPCSSQSLPPARNAQLMARNKY